MCWRLRLRWRASSSRSPATCWPRASWSACWRKQGTGRAAAAATARAPRRILCALPHAPAAARSDPAAQLAAVHRVAPYWGPELPGYAELLALRARALLACGRATEALAEGARAVDLCPRDMAAGARGEGRASERADDAWTDGCAAPHRPQRRPP